MNENSLKVPDKATQIRAQRPVSVPASHSSAEDLKAVRIAVIGCGAISRQLHLPILAGHEGVELVALVDRDVKRAAELARGYGVRAGRGGCGRAPS